MSRRTTELTEGLYDYFLRMSVREPAVMHRLREETASLPEANMQMAPEQAQLLGLIVELMDARRCLEIGTFTGYSTLAMALALPDGGTIVACDINDEWTSIARRYWAEAGMLDRIDLRLARAGDTLDELIAEGASGTFDLALIDADKESYRHYYEHCLELLRPGGLVAVDNVLWHGTVVDESVNDADTTAIRAFNENIRDDGRITLSVVPIGDGLTLARKRVA